MSTLAVRVLREQLILSVVSMPETLSALFAWDVCLSVCLSVCHICQEYLLAA